MFRAFSQGIRNQKFQFARLVSATCQTEEVISLQVDFGPQAMPSDGGVFRVEFDQACSAAREFRQIHGVFLPDA